MIQPGYAAGSGTLKGRVLDQTNGGTPLLGANIIVQNTSLGIAASVDGNFQIKFVPASNWKVKVSCIGYVTVTRDITIIENETARCIFAGYRLKGKMDQVTLIL